MTLIILGNLLFIIVCFFVPFAAFLFCIAAILWAVSNRRDIVRWLRKAVDAIASALAGYG